jgi:hypothetical protein
MKYSEREAKRNGKKFTVVALWDDGPVAEAWYDRKARSWECNKCRSGVCEHVRAARAWLSERRKQQKEASFGPVSTELMPRKKFAPCPD